jgi:serine/tyrosine/threonine adenylyltransferase
MKLENISLTTPYLELESIFYHEVKPTPLHNPKLVSYNPDAAQLLGLESDQFSSEYITHILNGTQLLNGSRPYAMCYAGHQFGYFVPRL